MNIRKVLNKLFEISLVLISIAGLIFVVYVLVATINLYQDTRESRIEREERYQQITWFNGFMSTWELSMGSIDLYLDGGDTFTEEQYLLLSSHFFTYNQSLLGLDPPDHCIETNTTWAQGDLEFSQGFKELASGNSEKGHAFLREGFSTREKAWDMFEYDCMKTKSKPEMKQIDSQEL